MELHPHDLLATPDISEVLNSLSPAINLYPIWIAMTLSLWHHLLNFEEEVYVIWTKDYKNCASRVTYVIARYITDVTMIYGVYATSAISLNITVQKCINWAWLAQLLAVVLVLFRQIAVLTCIKSLWAGRKKLTYLLTLIWFTIFAPLCFMSVWGGIQAQDIMFILPFFRHDEFIGGICLVSRRIPIIPWLLGLISVGDLIQLVTMVVNALDTPRSSDKQIIARVIRDGAAYYLLNFVIRIVATLILCLANLKYFQVTWYIHGVLASILPSHHFLQFFKAAKDAELKSDSDLLDDDEVHMTRYIVVQ